MNTKTKILALAISATLSASLVGCGGGGGGSSGGGGIPPVTPPPVVIPDANALQTGVAAATYAKGSVEAEAYAALSSARSQYGVGLLAEHAALNTSATNHAKYIVARFVAGDFNAAGHTEDPSKAGYTGATPSERGLFAKYPATATGEALTSFIQVDAVQSIPGQVSIENLLAAPYHRIALFGGNRDVGFGHASTRIPGEGGLHHILVANFGVQQGLQAQLPAQDWVGVWPLDKASNVLYSFAGESPNPIPVNNGACAGYPISVQLRNGVKLGTTSFTLTETVSGAVVERQVSTVATDPNPAYTNDSTAYIIPYKPLKLNTQYSVRFVGSKNGVAFEKAWSFTTTAQNLKTVYGCDPS